MKDKPDSFQASLIWGRIGAAVLCLTAFVLSTFGIDFTPGEQVEANETMTGILAGVAGMMALVSKLREKKRTDDAGKASVAMMATVLALALVVAGFATGCAPNQSATQQMIEQTNDAGKLAKAAYYDVAGIYTETAKTYLRYKPILVEKHPKIDKKVKDLVNEMKKALDDWKLMTDATEKLFAIDAGSEDFHNMRREILFELAAFIDGGN
jgi:hypothetical protein